MTKFNLVVEQYETLYLRGRNKASFCYNYLKIGQQSKRKNTIQASLLKFWINFDENDRYKMKTSRKSDRSSHWRRNLSSIFYFISKMKIFLGRQNVWFGNIKSLKREEEKDQIIKFN